MKSIIVVIGLRGAGKSTLLEKACNINEIVILKPSTTRSPRDDEKNQYYFEKNEEWDFDTKIWEIEKDEYKYGLKKSEIDNLSLDKVGLTTFAPDNIKTLENLRKQKIYNIITLGLNTIKNAEQQKARVENDPNRIDKDFETFLKVVKSTDYVFEGSADVVLDGVKNLVLVLLQGGALTHDVISSFLKNKELLKYADLNNVESASYDLIVGKNHWVKGEIIVLSEQNPTLEIPRYSYAIVCAKERANLPKNIIGRFDLKVSLFFKGAILSNGPQIDPGYQGSLFCLIFNSSDNSIYLKMGEHFSTIEFFTTVGLTEGYRDRYQQKDKFLEFMESNDLSGPGGKLDEYVGQITEIESRVDSKITTHSTWIMGGVIAALIILLSAGGWIMKTKSDFDKKYTEFERQKSSLVKRIDKLEGKNIQFRLSRSEIEEELKLLKNKLSNIPKTKEEKKREKQ